MNIDHALDPLSLTRPAIAALALFNLASLALDPVPPSSRTFLAPALRDSLAQLERSGFLAPVLRNLLAQLERSGFLAPDELTPLRARLSDIPHD